MHVTARVPVAGYTAGQTIDVEINVDNKSSHNCIFRVELAKVSLPRLLFRRITDSSIFIVAN